MPIWAWILIAVGAVVLVALVVGAALVRRRTSSLRSSVESALSRMS